jgi:hypothetical protein
MPAVYHDQATRNGRGLNPELRGEMAVLISGRHTAACHSFVLHKDTSQSQ